HAQHALALADLNFFFQDPFNDRVQAQRPPRPPFRIARLVWFKAGRKRWPAVADAIEFVVGSCRIRAVTTAFAFACHSSCPPHARAGRTQVAPSVRHLFESATSFRMHGIAAGKGLPAADRDVDIMRIDFQTTRMPSDALGREQSGAGAGKRVEYDGMAPGAVL